MYNINIMAETMCETTATTQVAPEFTFKPYKVSSVGQMSLPADLRRNLGVMDGGFIEACYFGEGLLVLPLGKSEDLIEQTFPYVEPNTRPTRQQKITELANWFQGDRSKSVRWTPVSDEIPPSGDLSIKRTQAMSETFRPYKVSRVGQFTLAADTRRDWNISKGG